jgi:DNA-binding NarL/FixJ family response regulator
MPTPGPAFFQAETHSRFTRRSHELPAAAADREAPTSTARPDASASVFEFTRLLLDIRRLDSQGVPGREIARTLGISRDSVTKYAGQRDLSPAPPAPLSRPGAS